MVTIYYVYYYDSIEHLWEIINTVSIFHILIICFINFSDLVHTTESLRSTKLSAGKIEKECSNFDVVLEPYREENARLTRENNELHLEVLKLKEQLEERVKGNTIF